MVVQIMMMTRQQLCIPVKTRTNLIKPQHITTSRENSVNTPPMAEVIPFYWRPLTWRGPTSRPRNVYPPERLYVETCHQAVIIHPHCQSVSLDNHIWGTFVYLLSAIISKHWIIGHNVFNPRFCIYIHFYARDFLEKPSVCETTSF
jgi:hypothetical protein